MTDHNSPARAYSSDVADDDPLAELARVVAGEVPPPPPQRRSVVTPTLPKQPPVQASKPVAAPIEPPPAPVRRPVITPSLDLEDALLAELGVAGDKPARGGIRPAAAPMAPAAPGKPAAHSAAPAAQATQAARASLEDDLLAELGFGEPLDAPALDDVPVPDLPIRGAQPARVLPAQEQPKPAPAAARMQPAMPPQARAAAAPPAPQERSFDEFEAILNPEPQEDLIEEAYLPPVPQEAAWAERFRLPLQPEAFDSEALDDGLDAAIQAVNPGMRPAADPLKSFDFGSAFEAEVKQLEVASPPPPPLPPMEALPRARQVPARQPVAAPPTPEPQQLAPQDFELPEFDEPAIRKPERFELPAFDEPAIAEPVLEAPVFEAPVFEAPVFEAPVPAPQPRILTERELDDHFASAFAEELDIGLQRREAAAEQAAEDAAPETRAMIVDERAFEAALDLESVLAISRPRRAHSRRRLRGHAWPGRL
jgi:hypothetical protein